MKRPIAIYQTRTARQASQMLIILFYCPPLQSVRCDWADTEIWAQHVGERKKKLTLKIVAMHRFITVLLHSSTHIIAI